MIRFVLSENSKTERIANTFDVFVILDRAKMYDCGRKFCPRSLIMNMDNDEFEFRYQIHHFHILYSGNNDQTTTLKFI